MAIYVDDMQPYKGKDGKIRLWCHMITDGDIEELHDFAIKIGLKRDWFQGFPLHRHQHYDLTKSMQKAAIAHGAKLITRLELGKIFTKKDELL